MVGFCLKIDTYVHCRSSEAEKSLKSVHFWSNIRWRITQNWNFNLISSPHSGPAINFYIIVPLHSENKRDNRSLDREYAASAATSNNGESNLANTITCISYQSATVTDVGYTKDERYLVAYRIGYRDQIILSSSRQNPALCLQLSSCCARIISLITT